MDENGTLREDVCESHGATQLARNGLTPATLRAGITVRVSGSLSRHSPYMCFFDRIEFDGRIINVNSPAASIRTVPSRRANIFGTWLLAPDSPSSGTSGPQPMMQFLTSAGKKAVAAYDPFKDDPTFHCDPVGVRRVWGAAGTPLEIVRDANGRDVILHHEWMDVRRIVHMNLRQPSTTVPRNSLGYSIGHFDGDMLVVETSSYAAGVLNQYVRQEGQPIKGLLHSAALMTTERIHLDAARQRLVVDIDTTDSEFFVKPFPTATTEYAPSELMIEPFHCTPEGMTGTIRK